MILTSILPPLLSIFWIVYIVLGTSSLGRGCLTGVSGEEARGLYGFPPIPWEYVTHCLLPCGQQDIAMVWGRGWIWLKKDNSVSSPTF